MAELLPEGLNGVVHGRGAIVALTPVAAEEVDYGSPRQGSVELGRLGNVETGIWELRDGAVLDTEVDELFVVISGGATIKLPGTIVLVSIFFLSFVLYYFVNWKYLSELWLFR